MHRYVAGKPEAQLRKKLATFLAKSSKKLIKAALKAHRLGKAADGPDFTGAADWEGIAVTTSAAAAQVAKDAGMKALGQLALDDDSDLTDQVSEDAIAWAKERGAELVGKRWVGDTLVDNPDAEWAITDSTRIMVNEIITTGVDEGLSADALADRLAESYAFSPDRAYTIARTELAYAHTQGNLVAWRASGVVEGKESILSQDHVGDDECNQNADEGPIPLDKNFGSGDDGPPYHPNCECALVAVLINQAEADAEGGD